MPLSVSCVRCEFPSWEGLGVGKYGSIFRDFSNNLPSRIIDQYRVKTDKRSGIVNDPNRADDPEYIVRLIQQVITVSVETVRIVKGLPVLDE
jgi:hypothetical protein